MVQVVVVFCVLAAQGDATAGGSSGAAAESALAAPSAARTALAAGAAIVPGVVVHGTGHFVAGHTRTGWTLLKLQGLGLASLVGGVAGLAVTGASRELVGVFALTSMAGAGLFLTSWLADVYGVVAPKDGFGSPMRVTPWLDAQVGVRFVTDPTLAGTTFFAPALNLRWRNWRLSPAAVIAADSAHSRWQTHLAYRLTGPRPTDDAAQLQDGSFVDVVVGAYHHRYTEGGAAFATRYRITSGEGRLDGRLDLARVAPTLTGAFVDGSAGLAVGAYRYAAADATDTSAALLGSFAFGMYFGRRVERWGEARLYYNHRHDDFAGGLKSRGVGSGAIGFFGAAAQAYLSQQFGVAAEVQAGSAFVTGLSVLYRHGKVAL